MLRKLLLPTLLAGLFWAADGCRWRPSGDDTGDSVLPIDTQDSIEDTGPETDEPVETGDTGFVFFAHDAEHTLGELRGDHAIGKVDELVELALSVPHAPFGLLGDHAQRFRFRLQPLGCQNRCQMRLHVFR